MVNGGRSQTTLMQADFQIIFLKNTPRAFTFTYLCPKAHYSGMLQLSNNADESSEATFHLQPQPCPIDSSMELQTNSERVLVGRNEDNLLQDLGQGLNDVAGGSSCSTKRNAIKDRKEMRRRRKIGLANKGKTPWNKGRKHSAGKILLFLLHHDHLMQLLIVFVFSFFSFCLLETRERIKQRTIEALRDPKVMSCKNHFHSDYQCHICITRAIGAPSSFYIKLS